MIKDRLLTLPDSRPNVKAMKTLMARVASLSWNRLFAYS